MRAALLFASALVLGWTAFAQAADLAVPVQKRTVIREPRPVAQPVCMRWIEQTYSWYNYCDPVPYYSRHRYDSWAGLF